MFDERAFVAQKQENWRILSEILEHVKVQGLHGVGAGHLVRLGSLYRRAAADLAYARTQHATTELIFYLNELVGEGHGILYQEHRSRTLWSVLRTFFVWEFPDALRRRSAFVIASIAVTIVAAVLASDLVQKNPANLNLFIEPGMQDSFNAWKQGFSDHGTISAGEGAAFAAFLMTHNTSVGLAAFALGITTILPLFMLFDNGCMMGALYAVVKPTGHLSSMWAGILPHGVCELSAIFICAGAGLATGWALIDPGRLSRREALIAASRDAIVMAVGTIPLFVIAGIIEGNVSHAAIPHWAKFMLAGVQLVALLYYVWGPATRLAPVRELAYTSEGAR